MKPQFKHKCPHCKFLGNTYDGKADLYYCVKTLDPIGVECDQIIVRMTN